MIACVVVVVIAVALSILPFMLGFNQYSESDVIAVSFWDNKAVVDNVLAVIVILLVIWSGYVISKANGKLIDTAKIGAILGVIIAVIYSISSEIYQVYQADTLIGNTAYQFDVGSLISSLVFYIILFAVLGAIAGVVGGFITKLNLNKK